MPDQVLLATDVYLPETGSRWPVLVSRLPYDKADDECFLPHIAAWFTERGYAVVAQDVRGKVRSGGELVPFDAEIADGYHTLDWVAAQSWCDGAIGMLGDSYYGFTQWAAAASHHPALRAIAPRATTADFRAFFAGPGVFPLEMAAYWAVETWVDEALYTYEGHVDWAVRPLSEIVPRALGGRRPVGLDDWANGRVSAGATVPVRGDIPALHLGGFYDFLLPAQLATWRQAVAAGSAPQHLLLDAVDHCWTSLRDPDQPYADPFASATTRQRFLDGYLAPLLPFLDQHLRGRAGTRLPPVQWRPSRGEQDWRHDDQWPPTSSGAITWHLTGDPHRDGGELYSAPDRNRRTVKWIHDPRHPVPSRIHPYCPLINPPDEQDLHARADVLAFTTPPLERPLELAGPALLHATLSTSAPSAHLIATLCDVYPDGRTHRILDGAALARAPWPAEVSIELGDTGYRLAPGHRLRVTLAASAFPRFALHPGTSEHFWIATDTASAELAVVLGGPGGANLTCHALEGGQQI